MDGLTENIDPKIAATPSKFLHTESDQMISGLDPHGVTSRVVLDILVMMQEPWKRTLDTRKLDLPGFKNTRHLKANIRKNLDKIVISYSNSVAIEIEESCL